MAAPPGADVILLRYGELGTKSGPVRGRMVARLCRTVEDLLAARGIDGTVEYDLARPRVHVPGSDVTTAARHAADAFGIVSTSPARRVSTAREAVLEALAETAAARYDGGTFAVRARRATDDLPYTSPELERQGGAAVWSAVEEDFEPAVDLEHPDLTFGVEVREDGAFVFIERFEGPGGLPLGTQSRLVALVSGGIDSPVAAYEAMRRGSPVTPVYLDLGEFGGADHRARAEASVRTLARFAPDLDEMVVVPAGETLSWLAERMDRGRMLGFRRYGFRVAEHVASEHGATGIVTGEAIGQKSSQTARNLRVTSLATDLPIHRPLLTADKSAITDRARRIGTFEDATVPAGCTRLAPDRPETAASIKRLRELEPDGLFERAERDAAAATLMAL